MAGPNNALLAQIAMGADPRMADAMFRGRQQGQNALAFQQAQETRNALRQAAGMVGQGDIAGAQQMLGQAGEFEPAYKLLADQEAAKAAAAKAALPVSSYGRTMYDERRGLVPTGTAQRQIGAIGSNGTNLTINTGNNIPVGKKAQGDLQADVLAGRVALANTKNIMENYKPTWLTYKGQGIAKGARIAEKAGFGEFLPDKTKADLGQYTKFKNAVESEFNRYRKEITGAAAAIQELEKLRQAIFNTDQSPTEFEASMANYVSNIQRLDQLRIQMLQQGIDPRTPEGGQVLDARFFGGGDQPAASPASPSQPQDGVIDYTDLLNEDN